MRGVRLGEVPHTAEHKTFDVNQIHLAGLPSGSLLFDIPSEAQNGGPVDQNYARKHGVP